MRKRVKVMTALTLLVSIMVAEFAYTVVQKRDGENEAKHAVIYVVEGLGGAVGTFMFQGCCGLCLLSASILIPSMRENEEEFIRPFWYTTLLMGAPISVTATGRLLRQRGSFNGALIGSSVGVGTVLLVEYLMSRREGIWHSLGQFEYFAGIIGAVIGYNCESFMGLQLCGKRRLGGKPNVQLSFTPILSLRPTKGESQKRFCEVNLNLLRVKF